jgi:purine-binding chemotaxis protein CheW
MGALTQVSPGAVAAVVDDNHQYLAFTLGGETYAIAILRIKEIISYGQLTTVPMMPPFVRGVINLRGSVVPVIDLMARFGRSQTEVQRRTCIVILEAVRSADDAGAVQQDIGVMVDAVNEVVEIPADQIEPAPAFGARIRSDFIRGMGKLNGRFVMILNLDSVLAVDELAEVDLRAPALEGPAALPALGAPVAEAGAP